MKKSTIFFLGMAGLLSACDPFTDETEMGGIVEESALKLSVYSTTDGGNEIVMVNHTKGVGSYWNYIVGKTASDSVVAVIPFLGQQTIHFTGLCDGGTVEATRTVNITQIDHPADVTWNYFAGTGTSGKKWTWDTTAPACYGDGGWAAIYAPNWDPRTADQTDDPNGYMVFDLNGCPNLTLYGGDGQVKAKGTFTFDMSDKLPQCDNGAAWGIGTLTLNGVTVLSGHYVYGSEPVYKYRILTINDHEMVLCAAPDGTEGWGDATFWLFRCE